MPQRLKNAADKLGKTGFFNIVGAGVLNKIIAFVSGIILVRVLSKSDYGAYSYALNIVNYFILLNGLGAPSCVVQLCIERGEDSDGVELVYRAASSIGMICDIVLTLVIVGTALFVPLPVEGSNVLLLFLAPFPFFSLIMDLQQQRLRSKFMNKEYALATNINTVSLALFSVGGAVVGSSVGLSIGRSIAMAVSSLIARLAYKIKVYIKPPKVDFATVMDILKMSITVCLTNAVSQILILAGTTMVGSLTGDQTAVASYTTATTIPFAMLFLPSMVMVYITPYFVQHSHERAWVIKRWIECTLAVAVVAILIAAVCVWRADWIIPFVFGSQYSSSVSSFQVLMVAFVVGSSLRSISGNVLATHRRYGFNFCSSVMSLIVALVATYLLVPSMGIVGAAAGYALAMLFGSVTNILGVLFFAGRPATKKMLSQKGTL